ncbi:hypothetical protein [Dongia sp.]|uniref:hypothetical protein n=1 Tax=Dongia sp. TaxID=1977262 RepID=UPI003752C1D8
MENTKTSELLDLIWELENTPEEKVKDDHYDRLDEANAELAKRSPFDRIIGVSDSVNDPTLEERADEMAGDIKLLKRHKHDDKSGDVMVRI